jgi:sRNA-binding protein
VPTKYLGILKDIVGRVYGSSGVASTSNVTQLSPNQGIDNDHFANADTNKPVGYDNLNDLVHDIKNRVVNTKDISLIAFKNSGAYQRADKQTQDCIDLAGKIGGKLEDQEISHCSEDPNYFKDKLSNTDNNNKADNTSN